MSIAPGSRLGPFDVTSPLGAGGMGQVFRARDSRLNRDVAVKILPPEFANDPMRMARFSREAQVLAALSHPNIAAIYGLEESGGASALVMELVEGQTLAERIAAGPIPQDEALAIARQIAEALEAAHEKGIIHRDLKPANIKVTPEGKVKVLDFGLAKAMDAAPVSGGTQANSPTLTLDSTRAGQIMGTAAYMSPEQARGKAVDKRADIWAFGVVLFEMLTGRSMFEGETVSDTLAAVLRADIDLRSLPPGTPPKLRRLLGRCLERDPKRRLRDIGDAWIEIDAPDEPAPVVAAPPPAKRAAWLPWTVAAVLGGLGVTWGLLKERPAPSRPVTRWHIPQKGLGALIDLSRDGTRLAYTGGNINAPFIGVRTLDQFEGKMLPGTEDGFFPVFSPDGQWIVYSTSQNKIRKVPVSGGASITLCEGNAAQGAAWGPDDTILFSSGKGLWRVPAAGGTPEAVTNVDAKAGEVTHSHPQFLPNGQVLFTILNAREGAAIAALDLSKKSYRTIVPAAGAKARYVSSGHLIYQRAGTLFALPFDLKRMAPAGNETPVVDGVSSVGPTNNADYGVSEDGLLVYVVGASGISQGTTYAWSDRKGSIRPITTTPQPWGDGRLSPDGGRIANGLSRPGSNDRDIWILDIARNVSTRLTFDGGNDNPIWTPDGKRLIYGNWRGGKAGIYSVPADASSGPELLLAVEAGRAVPSSVTPDGKTIVYTLVSPNARPKIVIFTQGSQPRALHEAPFAESNGQLSPDGKWLAYQSAESGSQEIYVTPFPGPGAKVRVSQNNGVWPRWSRNMRELFFWAGASPVTGLMAAPIQPGASFQAGTPELLFSSTVGTTWDPSPDAKQFLVEPSPATSILSGGGNLAVVTGWFEELKRRAPAKR